MTCWMMRHIKRILGSKTIFWLAIFYNIVITTLFFIPTSGLPSVGGAGMDKVAHVLFFFFLTMLWQLVIFKRRGDKLTIRSSILLLGLILIYGTLIEILQGQLTASRTADFFDVVADLVGAGIGVLVFHKVKHLFST